MAIRPKLSTLLIIINLVILLLPLGGIAVLRLYENELVKQTESELIGQATLLTAAFKEAYLSEQNRHKTKGYKPSKVKEAGEEDDEELAETVPEAVTPIHPHLDLSNALILPPAPPPAATATAADPLAIEAAKKVAPLIAAARKTVLSGSRVVDQRGVIVATSATDIGLSIAAWDEVAKALAGESTSQLRTRNSKHPGPALASISRGAKIRVFVSQPVLVDDRIVGAIVVSRTPLDVVKAMYQIRKHLLKATLAILFVALCISLLVAYYLNRPLKTLIRQAEMAQAGQGFDRTGQGPPGILEFDLLSDAMSRMAATIEARSGYIKTFAATVSHEFKTPLTSLRGAMELLREHYEGMSSTERESFLAIIEQETGRLELLVGRLLELARADAYTPAGEQTLLQNPLEEIIGQYRAKGLKISASSDCPKATVCMAPEVLATVFSNLLGNVLMHNGTGTAVEIRLNCITHENRKMAELVFSDNGKGISAANAERIFRPFFTTAKDLGGSGLGLAIIRSLLEAHGGTIMLLPSITGATFRLLLPICPVDTEQ